MDEDLRLLYKGIGEMDTKGTPTRLHAVKVLGMQDLYFVDVEQWREALGGMEAVVMIPLICMLRYEYEVLIGLSGITGSDLYGVLASAIRRVRVPESVQPLTGSFGHIISAYNNFPKLDSIQPFSLGHGRRVCYQLCICCYNDERWT